MPDSAAYCPGCGRSMQPIERAHGSVGALPVTIAGALAYLTFLPAIAFLLVEPYRKDRFIRFHSFQCLGLWLAAVIIGSVLRLASFLVSFIPIVGHLVVWLTAMLSFLAFFAIWLVLMVKALQGEMYELPIIGEYAENRA